MTTPQASSAKKPQEGIELQVARGTDLFPQQAAPSAPKGVPKGAPEVSTSQDWFENKFSAAPP
jgi:hypothetical protein